MIKYDTPSINMSREMLATRSLYITFGIPSSYLHLVFSSYFLLPWWRASFASFYVDIWVCTCLCSIRYANIDYSCRYASAYPNHLIRLNVHTDWVKEIWLTIRRRVSNVPNIKISSLYTPYYSQKKPRNNVNLAEGGEILLCCQTVGHFSTTLQNKNSRCVFWKWLSHYYFSVRLD